MKTFFYLLKTSAVVFTAAAILSSCANFLNLPPLQDLDADGALTNAQGIETAITGAYQIIQGGNMWGGDMLTMTEVFGDFALPERGNLDFHTGMYANRNLNFFNAHGRGHWGAAYDGINRVNNVLARLNSVSDLSEANRNRIRGEALFLRGLFHFELVRWFALPFGATMNNTHPGVIIRTEPTTSPNSQGPRKRNTVAEVYDQVIKDLTEAENLLPVAGAPGHIPGRASKGAAAGILSRVYFQQNNFARAAEAASRVIANTNYRLADLNTVFGENAPKGGGSPEVIFDIRNRDDNNNNGIGDATRYDGFFVPFMSASDTLKRLIASFPANDKRRAFFQDEGAPPNRLFINKFAAFVMNIPVIRLGEVYLTRAECRAETGDAAGALADLNAVRARAGIPPLTGLSGTALRDAIRRERAMELIFEGDRFQSLKRMRAININPLNPNQRLPFDSPQLLWKIPDTEMNANPLMEQNP
ncbi:MAG: RagB/SusD family nutrient uptake outer membrane protein [Bacteroidota bacterium]|nr:RagB/SusD family nutrient uptake outer membrane protein [Candidatus Kapabacteria bacterium]MDW8219780.1 RagB/SusD family nutrient uptake outer membrane protein [Bacteroidota bacterium]